MIQATVISSHPALEQEVLYNLARVRLMQARPCFGRWDPTSATCEECRFCGPCALKQGSPRAGFTVWSGDLTIEVSFKDHTKVVRLP